MGTKDWSEPVWTSLNRPVFFLSLIFKYERPRLQSGLFSSPFWSSCGLFQVLRLDFQTLPTMQIRMNNLKWLSCTLSTQRVLSLFAWVSAEDYASAYSSCSWGYLDKSKIQEVNLKLRTVELSQMTQGRSSHSLVHRSSS